MRGQSDATGITRRELAIRAGGVVVGLALVSGSAACGGTSIEGRPVNLVANPRVAEHLEGWLATVGQSEVQPARVRVDAPAHTSTAAEVEVPSGAEAGVVAGSGAVEAGSIAWISAAAQVVDARAPLELRVMFLDDDGRALAVRPVARMDAPGNVWLTMRGFALAPAGTAAARPMVALPAPPGRARLRATNALLVLDPRRPLDYFDGDHPDGSWLGEPHASASVGRGVRPAAPARADMLAGLNDNSAQVTDGVGPERDVALHVAMGSRLLRATVDLRGRAFQARPGASVDWDHPYAANYDLLYRTCREAGLEFLPIPLFCPDWMDVPDGSPPPRRHLSEWASICGQLAARWPESVAVEVWNEPNLGEGYWFPSADPAAYVALLAAARRAIKAERPSMPVLNGGLAGSLVSGRREIAAAEYLSGMYAAGAKDLFDGLSYHAYPERPASGGRVAELTAAVRRVMAENGDSKPRWLTEIGTSTGVHGPAFAEPVTEAQQATVNCLLYGMLKREPDLRAICFHTLLSSSSVPAASFEAGFEFVARTTGREKPVYYALAEELAGERR